RQRQMCIRDRIIGKWEYILLNLTNCVKIPKNSENSLFLEKQSRRLLAKLYLKGVIGIEKSSMHRNV
ncbi:hypothetical protein, partial [Acinetobacter baumannii]|uniref:hypothetical protein n=1 Tax=Acinetobacter baumannii TaxID=470 RepID=UPI0039F03D86